MGKFSYTLELYKNNIFGIDNESDQKKLLNAAKDAEKIEKYFSNVPNVDLLRENIILSYKFDKYIDYKDRINFIRGLVYGRRYIDISDIYDFLDSINEEPVRYESTIFHEKGDSTYMSDFFMDAFYEDMNTTYEVYREEQLRKLSEKDDNKPRKSFYTLTDTMSNEDEDDYDDEENAKNAVKEMEEELNIGLINLTPREKLEAFKDNFENYITEIIERKNITKEEENRGRQFIIIGMRKWVEYAFSIMDDLIEIGDNKRKLLSRDLSQFI